MSRVRVTCPRCPTRVIDLGGPDPMCGECRVAFICPRGVPRLVEALRQTLVGEWRHTFLSARRDYSTRIAARMWLRELRWRLTPAELRAYAQEMSR